MIKKLVVFDFDGTLIDSPMPETGKIEWSEKKGKPYPYLGWWGRPESLDLDIFDIKPFPSVLTELQKEINAPNTYVVILTSRMEKLRQQVQSVLNINHIQVDKLDMKRAEGNKGVKLLRYVSALPDLREISVYEDRDTDIEAYEAIRNQIPEGVIFNLYLAENGNFALHENRLVNIIKEEIQNFLIDTLNATMDLYHGADMNNLKDLRDSPQILPPEMKMRLPSNTGGYYIGLSTSTDVDKARRYSRGFGHNKVIHLQLLAGAKIIEIDTQGQGIDDIFTGDDLENYQKHGVDAIIELDDMAESEVRLLNSGHLKVIEII